MKLNHKRILSLVLALVLVMSTAFMASSTFATEDVETGVETEEIATEDVAADAEGDVEANEGSVAVVVDPSEEVTDEPENSSTDITEALPEEGDATGDGTASAEELIPGEEVSSEENPSERTEEDIPVIEENVSEEDTSAEETEEIEKGFVGIDGSAALQVAFQAPVFQAANGPANSKKLYDNGDGTYTLSLNVTGSQSSSSSSEVDKANVILVLDTSSSMNTETGNTYYLVNGTPGNPANEGNTQTNYYRLNNGGYSRVYYRDGYWYTSQWGGTVFNGPFYARTRLWAEIHALVDDNGIIDSLLAQNVAGDPNKSDIIEVSIINFDMDAETASEFTTSATALKTAVNNLKTASGTNWEEALQAAKAKADAIKADPNQKDEGVYVIFLTDGQPSVDAVDGEYRDHNIAANTTQWNQAWTASSDDARAIVTGGSTFYGLFTWGSSTYEHYIKSIVNYAYTGTGNYDTALSNDYAGYYTNADSTEALIAALKQITHDITESVGYTNVELQDGVTTMTSSSIEVSGGTVSGLKYYRSGGSYGAADPDHGVYGTEWTEAPSATIKDGKVDWNLGDMMLENGVTYTVTFVVWPRQESLDLVADLNNGKKSYNDLTEDEKSQIVGSAGHYSLKTNTDYPTLTYSTVTETTVDGKTTRVVSDPTTINITNPDPVGLAGSGMVIRKIWAVDLQTSRLQQVLYNEDGSSKELTVTLDIFRDNVKYGDVVLGWDAEQGAYVWADTAQTIWEDSFAVAPGVMVTSANMAQYAKSTFVFNGKTYYILENGHDYELRENDFKDYHFDLVTEIYHPMIVDGKVKNVKFTYSGTTIKGIESITPEGDNEELTSLDATNTLRGGINLNKIVLDPEGEEYPTEDEFEFTITLNNESSVFVGDSIPWYSVNGNYYHDEDGNYISEDEAKAKYGDSYEDYGNILTGNATSVTGTITITCNDTVRIANVPVGTTYTITESEANGYTVDDIDHGIQLSDGTQQEDGVSTVDLDKRTIEGEIVPNRENNITYKNKMTELPAFYVYHSSDNSIEKIFVDDDRVTRTVDETTGLSTYTFNIVNETLDGSLYGGYYKAYGDTTSKDSNIIALIYTEEASKSIATAYDGTHTGGFWASDTSGKPYTGSKATAWKKASVYTVKGTEATVIAKTVYYLKEVPKSYLRPYIHIVYDKHDDNNLVRLYTMTALDDANYTEAGFYNGSSDAVSTKLSATVKITDHTGKTSTLTAKTVFNGKVYPDASASVPRGYLTSIETSFGSTFDMQPYFKTLDGVKVYGVTNRTVDPGDSSFVDDGTGKGMKPGITVTDVTNVKSVE